MSDETSAQYPQQAGFEPQHGLIVTSPAPTRGFRRRAVAMVSAAVIIGGTATGAGFAIGSRSGVTDLVGSPSTSITQGSGGSGTGGLGGSGGGGRYVTPPDGGTAQGGSSASAAASDATAAQSVGLVEISSTLANGRAAGTGVVLTSDGYVVTNHHVVAGSTSLTVTVVSTGKTYQARYIGGDATVDVAVIQLVGASGLTPATLSATPAAVGDTVTAVGDANGDGGSLTASPGTVAALDQDISVQDEDGGMSNLTGLIQVSAYVVPGDSGGAVLDGKGAVVGMNVAASAGGRNVTGFAIPIATVRSVADQIRSGHETAQIQLGYHGFLGVALQPSVTVPQVASVEAGSAAARAGIVAGDTITSLNGTAITSATQLRGLLADLPAGAAANVDWQTTAGGSRSATVTLGQAPIA